MGVKNWCKKRQTRFSYGAQVMQGKTHTIFDPKFRSKVEILILN